MARVVDVISDAFRQELRRRLPDSPELSEATLKALVLASREYLSGLNTACSRTDRQFRLLIEARVQGELYELLVGWIEALPEGRQPPNPGVTASVVSWAIFGVGLQWSRYEVTVPAEEIVDRAFSVIVEGLRL
jgi:hypothetical protein